jgi:hypothetical protein
MRPARPYRTRVQCRCDSTYAARMPFSESCWILPGREPPNGTTPVRWWWWRIAQVVGLELLGLVKRVIWSSPDRAASSRTSAAAPPVAAMGTITQPRSRAISAEPQSGWPSKAAGKGGVPEVATLRPE